MLTAAVNKHFVAVAGEGARWRRRTASSIVTHAHRGHYEQQQSQQGSNEAELNRRAVVVGAAATLTVAALPQQAFAECEFQAAPSGLQWCDVAVGTGESPVPGARIRAHYTGRLQSNGVVFDSSYERGRPLNFQVGVGQVIKGWDMGILGAEGIPPMKAGGKRQLVIPADLAYGQRGAGGVIPPNATLIFDVEYLGKYGQR